MVVEVTPTPATPVRSEIPFVGPQCQPWVELSRHPCPVMGTPKHSEPTGAKGRSHGNLVVAVLRGCAAVLVFSLGLYFVLDARSLWTWRDESAGEEGLQWFPFPMHPIKCPLLIL